MAVSLKGAELLPTKRQRVSYSAFTLGYSKKGTKHRLVFTSPAQLAEITPRSYS